MSDTRPLPFKSLLSLLAAEPSRVSPVRPEGRLRSVPVTMQGETTAIRIAENEGKLDVFPQIRTPGSGRASAKSWQYR